MPGGHTMKAQRALTLWWRTQGLGALAGSGPAWPRQLGPGGCGCGSSPVCVLDPERSSCTTTQAVPSFHQHVSTPARIPAFATSPWTHLAVCHAPGASGRAATVTERGMTAHSEAPLHRHRPYQGIFPLGLRPLCATAAASSRSSSTAAAAAAAATHTAAAAAGERPGAKPPDAAAADSPAPTSAPDVVKEHVVHTRLRRDNDADRSSAASKRDKDADPKSVMMRFQRTWTVGALRRLVCRPSLQDTLRTNPLLLAALSARLVHLWQDLQQQHHDPHHRRHQGLGAVSNMADELQPHTMAGNSSLPARYQQGSKQWAGGEGEGEGEATGEEGLQEAGEQVRRVLAHVAPMVAGVLPQMGVGQLASTVWALAKLQLLWRAGGADTAGAGAGAAAHQHDNDGEGQAADGQGHKDQGRGQKRRRGPRVDLTTGVGAATADGPTPPATAAHGPKSRKRGRGQLDTELEAQLDAVLWGAVQRLADDWAQRPERGRMAAWGGEGGAGQGEQRRWWFDRPVAPADGRTTEWGAEARKVDVAQLAWGLVRTGVGVGVGLGGGSIAGQEQQERQQGARVGEGQRESRKALEAAWAWLAARTGDLVWRGEAREVANVVWAFAAARRPEAVDVCTALCKALDHPRRREVLLHGGYVAYRVGVKPLAEAETCAALWGLAATAAAAAYHVAPGGAAAAAAAAAARGGAAAARPDVGGRQGQQLPWPLVSLTVGRLAALATSHSWQGMLTGRQTSTVLWSLATLQQASQGAVEVPQMALEALLKPSTFPAAFMDGRALANAAWALSTLFPASTASSGPRQQEGPPAYARNAMAAVAAAAAQRWQEQQEHQGQLHRRQQKHQPGDQAAHRGSAPQHYQPQQQRGMSARDLLQVLWACGRMGVADPDGELVAAAQALAQRHGPSLDAWAVASCMAGLAALDAHDMRTFNALCRRAEQLLPPPALGPAPAASLTAAHAAPRGFPGTHTHQQLVPEQQLQHGPHDDGSAVNPAALAGGSADGGLEGQGWGTLGVDEAGGSASPGLAGSENDSSRCYSGCLSPGQLVLVVWALARTEHTDSGLLEAACEVLVGRLGQLQPREVCRLVAALGRLQHSQPALMAAVQDHLLYGNNALSYGAEDLVALMHGLARAGAARQCGPLFERAASLLLMRRGGGGGGSGGSAVRGLRGVGPQGLVQLAGALAARGEPCDALFEEIATEALRRAEQLSRPQVERIAEAYRSLGYEGAEELIQAWREAVEAAA